LAAVYYEKINSPAFKFSNYWREFDDFGSRSH
jgi:hypothetical protein